MLRRKNNELRSEYKDQEHKREMLVKQLVLQKRETSKLGKEMEEFNKILADTQQEQEGETIELDKIGISDVGGMKTKKKSLASKSNSGSAMLSGRQSMGGKTVQTAA